MDVGFPAREAVQAVGGRKEIKPCDSTSVSMIAFWAELPRATFFEASGLVPAASKRWTPTMTAVGRSGTRGARGA